ncbi:hypothetical protein [Streptomyces diastatochromogenes]|uniref:Uncharacterized protein n=1 Tax=Streptomyces diastatochromogenes TaxID=42236 RepID=A0A233SAC5_STRDA|nr:hypothetical protein [Streptomyces diastatochromogenes]OXY92449.1 hypothetical protein BEK98_27175 [Streptomyces diastatochromogenes]
MRAEQEVVEENVRNALARSLFRGARAHLPVRVPSGGERLRATPACVLCAEPAPHLLLLDDERTRGVIGRRVDSYSPRSRARHE